MMKKLLLSLLVVHCSLFVFSQGHDTSRPMKIAVFSPIYLDSSFNGPTFKLDAGNLPKSTLPGLEFYNGIMMAVDSLQSEHTNIEVLVFDSKSVAEPMNRILASDVWDSVSLIIVSFNSRADIKPLASFAASKNIPLISSTFPNDGGVSSNPFFVLVNSSLRTHIEGIYKHLQKHYSTGNLVYVRKKGPVEDMIQHVFASMGKSTPGIPLKYKSIELTDSFTNKQLLAAMDSTKNNVVICGTINEAFGGRLIRTLNAARSYPAIAIGMPTWDGIREVNKAAAFEGKGIELVYSTPYNFSRTDKLGAWLTSNYKDKYFARPSDWVFKGFESMYHFTKLLIKYRNDFINHLSDRDAKLFNDFDIQPVRLKKENTVPDYLENKKLYFIKKQDGVVKSIL